MKSRMLSLPNNLKKDPNLVQLLIIFAISFVAMAVLEPGIFLTKKYMVSMMFLFPEYGILALAMMLAMISGGIDLSIIATANFSAIIAIKFLIRFCPAEETGFIAALFLVAALLIAIAVGGCCGALIGFFIGKVGIPPMLATLAGADLIMGLSLIITKGSSVKGFPVIVSAVGTKILFGFLPITVVVFAVCAILVWYILSKTKFGIRMKMMGSNPISARFSGINNVDIIFKTYILGGMLSAVAGMLLISRANSARADYGSSYIMQAIIICVLGGTNPNGGFGKVSGVTVAILILQVLSSGFNMFPQMSNFYRSIIWGAVLILVVIYNHVSSNNRIKKMARQDNQKAVLKS